MVSSPTSGTSAPDELVLQEILKRDKILVLFGLATVGIITWAYTIHTSIEVDRGTSHHAHSAVDFLLRGYNWTDRKKRGQQCGRKATRTLSSYLRRRV
jgi:predicted metal-binding membrane protein